MKLIKLKKRTKGGFSFIESMLAVFLVSVGVIAALQLLTTGISYSIDSRNQFIASLLAQEGVELVRNMRDNNWVDNDPATGSFSGFPGNGAMVTDYENCRIDKDFTTSMSCNDAESKKLNLVNGYYSHSAGSGTKFKRIIYISFVDINADNEVDNADVTSLVTWGSEVFPAINDVSNKCNTVAKCAYARITLNKWGE